MEKQKENSIYRKMFDPIFSNSFDEKIVRITNSFMNNIQDIPTSDLKNLIILIKQELQKRGKDD